MATKKAHPAESLAPEIADTEDHKTMPDGRTMRAERNRQAVVEAFSLLLKEGGRATYSTGGRRQSGCFHQHALSSV